MKSPSILFRSLTMLLAVAVAMLMLASPAAQAQERSPERVLQEFYQWYVQALSAGRDPFAKNKAELKKYATDRLMRQVEKARKDGSLGADPFLDAQDFDKAWAKNVKVSGEKIQDEKATANVELNGPEMGTHKLAVTLKQEDGAWKVDKAAMR